jgi:hypothetical protein
LVDLVEEAQRTAAADVARAISIDTALMLVVEPEVSFCKRVELELPRLLDGQTCSIRAVASEREALTRQGNGTFRPR